MTVLKVPEHIGFVIEILINSWLNTFDPFGLIMPHEVSHYLSKSGKKIVFSQDEIQNRDTVVCGYWCLYYLIERQKGKSILDVIHHEDFDHDNSDFIQDYFINHRFFN